MVLRVLDLNHGVSHSDCYHQCSSDPQLYLVHHADGGETVVLAELNQLGLVDAAHQIRPQFSLSILRSGILARVEALLFLRSLRERAHLALLHCLQLRRQEKQTCFHYIHCKCVDTARSNHLLPH